MKTLIQTLTTSEAINSNLAKARLQLTKLNQRVKFSARGRGVKPHTPTSIPRPTAKIKLDS